MDEELDRLLVIGASGLLGSKIMAQARGRYAVRGAYNPDVDGTTLWQLDSVDIGSKDDIDKLFDKIKPDKVILTAAMTNVDACEKNPTLANRINAAAPGLVARACKKASASLVHVSTDYVFDGSKGSPYEEDDEPNPKTVYGASKLAGEEAVKAVGGRYVILRLAWVFGIRGQNFLQTMLRLAKQEKEIRVVDDQRGSPTWSRMVAEASAIVARGLLMGDDRFSSGIYHLPSGGSASWFEFATKIFELAKPHFPWDQPVVTPVTTAEYPTPASRPAYSLLSGEKIRQQCGIELPKWYTQLEQAISDLVALAGGN